MRKKHINMKLQRCNEMHGIIKCHFGKHMTTDTELRLVKQFLYYGSDDWIINKKEAQELEAAQMEFLRPFLGLTRPDRQRNTDIRNRLR
jgi:hypothetical protein